MGFASSILIILGLSIFEAISSVDNAMINAQVLSTMSKKAKGFFLFWGLLIGVFLVRGLLPFLIIWMLNPSLSPIELIAAAFSADPTAAKAVEQSSGILLVGGGIFLLFLFFNWLFKEPKEYGLRGERFFIRQGVWFYAVVSLLLTAVVWLSLRINPLMALGAVVGSTAFFITHGFKENAELAEKNLLQSSRSDISKILYLEVIDMAFSIDGVLGAFAFTLSVPLILLGNGLGAVVVRQITVSNIERIKRYKYLNNGAMYSVLFLGVVMLFNSFGVGVPEWVSPAATLLIVGYFFWKSRQ